MGKDSVWSDFRRGRASGGAAMSAEEETGEPPERMIDDLDEFFESVRFRGLVAWAEGGDMKPLIEHIENGGEIESIIREFLVRHLRGEVGKRGKTGKKRGPKPKKATLDRKRDIAMDIFMLMKHDGIKRSEAKKAYLERYPDLNEETLDGFLRELDVRDKS